MERRSVDRMVHEDRNSAHFVRMQGGQLDWAERQQKGTSSRLRKSRTGLHGCLLMCAGYAQKRGSRDDEQTKESFHVIISSDLDVLYPKIFWCVNYISLTTPLYLWTAPRRTVLRQSCRWRARVTISHALYDGQVSRRRIRAGTPEDDPQIVSNRGLRR